jgi:hypothetical protein
MNDVVNPVKSGQETPHVREALLQACDQAGLDPRGAQLIHHYANAVYLLPVENVVGRIMFGPQSAQKAALSVAVTRWLVTEHHFPATAPIPKFEPVAVESSTTATFWTYYPQPQPSGKPTSAHLGPLIRKLHELPYPPTTLPDWVPLRSLEHTVRSPTALAAITAADRDWLLRHIDETRRDLEALEWPLGWGFIHGDAWAGNLLWHHAAGPDATVLGDWDSVCRGPREIDLIPSFHAARRYGRGPQWAQAFADAYGYDLSTWPGFATLFAMRDLIQLSAPLRRAPDEPALARALHQRLEGIKGHGPPTWTEF